MGRFIRPAVFAPNQIASSKDKFSINLFSKLCLLLNKQGCITTLCADLAETSHKLFIANADVKNQMKEFNMHGKLDVFHMSHLSHHVELIEVVKLMMILSPVNVLVESGSESSLVARRMVFDDVMNEGGISNVVVNRKTLKFVNNAHSEYVKQLEKQTATNFR